RLVRPRLRRDSPGLGALPEHLDRHRHVDRRRRHRRSPHRLPVVHSIVRFLCALVAAGCVYPAQVRDEHPVSSQPTENKHPDGPELLWLDATSLGGRIEIHAQLARGCLRDMTDTVEAHIHREAKLTTPSSGDALIALIPVFIISSAITGV